MEARSQSQDQLFTGEAAVSEDPQRHGEEAEDNERDGFGRRLSDIDRQYATQTGIERRIHIVGTGSIGKLVAHSLRGLPNPPPVTLIFHRYKLLEAWDRSNRQITLEDNGFPVARGGIQIELMQDKRRLHNVEADNSKGDVYSQTNEGEKPHVVAERMKQEQEAASADNAPLRDDAENELSAQEHPGAHAIKNDPIHNLIITTKAAHTIPALLAIRHRITPDSTICFLQNGMGTIDEVNKEIFPDIERRPNYMQGIITHGVNVPPQKAAQDPFFAVHAGHGTIALGLLPKAGLKASPPSVSTDTSQKDGEDNAKEHSKNLETDKWAPSSRYLLRTLTSSPVLCAVGFTPAELLQQQLEKLAVNSVLNVLTGLIDNRNGSILYNFAFTRTVRLMLAETSQVIRSLPELQNVPNVNLRFSPDRLESVVVSVAQKTGNNISSTLADVRAGRETELEYINGYIVRRGEEVGIQCVVNYALMQTVIGKQAMVSRDLSEEIPDVQGSLNVDA